MKDKVLFIPACLVSVVRNAIETRAEEFSKAGTGTLVKWQKTADELRKLAGKLK